ncbi:cobalt ABC transporter substrate-bindng protein [Paenibacillus selenitireducens]|uniref:Cobalt ABC transporter substrate-binding protein n=1 Tax=Paenibacillus selenitireducens TaxID=1324314 RepID=A0A1T2X8A0_9BACL|nr:DUF4198 domain-containing protein [Paenibacillus selenitireducens]OPA76119.1 cobalt ABC transporter substrate-bindng protein [Paenibacillus selenitireducens]
MKKKFAALAMSTLLLAAFAVPASAHDGWSQTNSPVVASGEVSYVDLMLGNHSNEHASYRIAGKWSTDTTKVYVTTPAGKKADITSTIFYTGEEKEDANAGINNEFVTKFSSSAPGAYIISAEGDSIFKSADVSSRTLRSAKSFVAIADIPLAQRVQNLKGFSAHVTTDRAELVPQFNPAAITPDKQVQIQLLLKDKPLADTEVSVIRRSTSEAQKLKTDSNGMITFQTGAADYYLVRAKPSTDEKVAGQYDSVSYEATMTFIVQNGTTTVSGKASGAPTVYVNGKSVDAKGITVNNGVTMVDASFIRDHVQADFEGTGLVALRASAEKAEAHVEVLNAVGELRAAVLIYTK